MVEKLLIFGIGYVLGTRAGKERFDELVAMGKKFAERDDVKMARPGATGFLSSGDGGAVRTVREQGGLDLAAVLLNPAESFPQRLSDAAELITWRAINMGPEDVRKLMQLPERLWTQRHRIQNKLLSLGMNWMSKRMPNSHARDEQHRDVEGDQGARSTEER